MQDSETEAESNWGFNELRELGNKNPQCTSDLGCDTSRSKWEWRTKRAADLITLPRWDFVWLT